MPHYYIADYVLSLQMINYLLCHRKKQHLYGRINHASLFWKVLQ